MTIHELVDVLLKVIQVVILPTIGLVGKWLHTALTALDTKVDGVRDQMLALNGRMLTQEQWARSHDKSDDERHATTNEALHDVRDAIRGQP